MSFLPTPSPTYYAPCTFRQLNAEGNLVDIAFDCQFKRLSRSQTEDLDKRMAQWRAENSVDVDARVLQEICLGWRVKAGDEVKVIPYTADYAREAEEENAGFIAACVRGFYLSQQPSQAAHLAQEKNS